MAWPCCRRSPDVVEIRELNRVGTGYLRYPGRQLLPAAGLLNQASTRISIPLPLLGSWEHVIKTDMRFYRSAIGHQEPRHGPAAGLSKPSSHLVFSPLDGGCPDLRLAIAYFLFSYATLAM